MPRGRRHSRREIRPTASVPSHIAWSRQWDRARFWEGRCTRSRVAIRRASLIKINYVCRVIVRLIESRDSAASAAKSFRPETKAENGTAMSAAESTFCTDALLFPRPWFFSCRRAAIATISLHLCVINVVKRKENNRVVTLRSWELSKMDNGESGRWEREVGESASREKKKEGHIAGS